MKKILVVLTVFTVFMILLLSCDNEVVISPTEETYTDLDVTVVYPNNTKNGYYLKTHIRFSNYYTLPSQKSVLHDNTSEVHFDIPDSYFDGDQVSVTIDSDLTDLTHDTLMTSYVFSETTENPWQPPHTFTIKKGVKNKATISFSPRLNIQLDHQDWTDNNPVVSWDAYPGAEHGYYILVLVEDKVINIYGDPDGSDTWDIAASHKVDDTQYKIFSNLISFTPIEISCGQGTIPPAIQEGDIIRIEVFVLDGTDTFSTSKHKGAIYMETLNVIRK